MQVGGLLIDNYVQEFVDMKVAERDRRARRLFFLLLDLKRVVRLPGMPPPGPPRPEGGG